MLPQPNFAKEQQVAQGIINAEATRPTMVLFFLWRSWATVWTQTPAMKQFAASVPTEISSILAHGGAEQAITRRQDRIHKNAMIV